MKTGFACSIAESEVDYMKWYKTDKGILVETCENFNLAQTLDCGQAFRWAETGQGVWHGVAGARALTLLQKPEGILFERVTQENFEGYWINYFDLERDYAELTEKFSQDETLSKAVGFCPGIRVLRQEPWEALCSFIISQNNNIPRIKGIIERLCVNFGDDLGGGDFSFPDVQRVARLSSEDLGVLRCGFRAKYISDAAQRVANGEINLSELYTLPLDEAQARLTQIYGVGPKVAQCTLLYGLGRADAFPVDVWVKKILAAFYPLGMPECTNGVRGIAQQYLFHYVRCVPEALE